MTARLHAHRHLLHVSKVAAFTEWAKAQGYRSEPLKGPYEVLRLRSSAWDLLVFHKRDRSEHLTVGEGPAAELVGRWLRERKAAASG